MDINAVFLGAGDDLFGNQPLAFGDHARRGIGLAVGQRNGLAGGVTPLLGNDPLAIGLASVRLPVVAREVLARCRAALLRWMKFRC